MGKQCLRNTERAKRHDPESVSSSSGIRNGAGAQIQVFDMGCEQPNRYLNCSIRHSP